MPTPTKPLHPRGVVLPATVHRYGAPAAFGVPWLDEPGSQPALVRFSRGGGLPTPLPDVLGIALRIDPDGDPGDLLFATTGRGCARAPTPPPAARGDEVIVTPV